MFLGSLGGGAHFFVSCSLGSLMQIDGISSYLPCCVYVEKPPNVPKPPHCCIFFNERKWTERFIVTRTQVFDSGKMPVPNILTEVGHGRSYTGAASSLDLSALWAYKACTGPSFKKLGIWQWIKHLCISDLLRSSPGFFSKQASFCLIQGAQSMLQSQPLHLFYAMQVGLGVRLSNACCP